MHEDDLENNNTSTSYPLCTLVRQAKDAYERAIRLEPSDQALQDAHHCAEIAEQKQAAARKHKFQAKPSGSSRPPEKRHKAARSAAHQAGPRAKNMKGGALSFTDADDEQDSE